MTPDLNIHLSTFNFQYSTFITAHRNDDIHQLALQAQRYPDIDMPFAIQQIDGWQRARRKLPMWANCDNIIYPPHISMEQCSSEQTAIYKQQLAKRLINTIPDVYPATVPDVSHATVPGVSHATVPDVSPATVPDVSHATVPGVSHATVPDVSPSGITTHLYDLTGGFGVDFSYMSKVFNHATYIEQQEHLCDIARHNFNVLELCNTDIVCANSTDMLSALPGRSNNTTKIIYLDPARRDANSKKTYAISDCTPDVITLLPTLKQKADIIIIKLSPMLDYHEAMRLLTGITEVHIVSVNNECKEILIIINQTALCSTEKDKESSLTTPMLYCVNDNNVFTTHITNHPNIKSSYPVLGDMSPNLIGSNLYIPNASIMKAGCFQALCQRFSLIALDYNSHLFISPQNTIESFPGRTFIITAVSSLNKKDLKTSLSGITHANIAVRNFPLTTNALRKKLSIKDGGDTYIFATTINKTHILLICRKKGATLTV